MRHLLLPTLVVAMAPALSAAEPLKIICASRAQKAPTIDGRLDDACWAKAEVCTDLGAVGDGSPVPRRTTMRFVYDDENLYMGLECFWEDISLLKKGIESIRASKQAFVNSYGVELFLDRGATRYNFYQILFNAAGQMIGNFRMRWDCFQIKGHRFKTTVGPDRWTVEFVYPAKGLKAGDRWGLNLVRNDESCYAMWRHIDGSFHQPRQFGTLLIGDYASWWQAVFGTDAARRLAAIRARIKADPGAELAPLYRLVQSRADALDRLARTCPSTNRANFERLHRAYQDFHRPFARLAGAYDTLQLIAKVK